MGKKVQMARKFNRQKCSDCKKVQLAKLCSWKESAVGKIVQKSVFGKKVRLTNYFSWLISEIGKN